MCSINTRILQATVSEMPLVLGLGTRLQYPYVDVVVGAPTVHHQQGLRSLCLIGMKRFGIWERPTQGP